MEATIPHPRTNERNILPLFLQRYSPRSFLPETVPKEHLLMMIEAARWAPSSYNSQPWRFVYAVRGTEHWETFVGFLNAFNQQWAKNAGALVVLLGKKTYSYNKKPASHWQFDCGAAWMNFALQARALGYYTHGMAGIERETIIEQLELSEDYEPLMMIAVGKRGDPSLLPEELREKEVPSLREPLENIAFEGNFKE